MALLVLAAIVLGRIAAGRAIDVRVPRAIPAPTMRAGEAS
jgi:hypothetical protein